MRVGKTRGGRQPKGPPLEYDKIWFSTTEICQHPDDLPPIQRKIFNNIAELQKHDLLDPQSNENDKTTFLAQFDWSHSALNRDQISEMQKLLVEYYDIFAKPGFDVGCNTELKVKLTPAHDLQVYVQSPPPQFTCEMKYSLN